MLKYSRQRESIKKCLSCRADHPTAETIYLSIKDEFPNISLGTVYRNLSLLSDLGEIRKISGCSGPDRFDARTEPHYHFLCRKCGAVSDLDFSPEMDLNVLAARDFAGRIEEHTLQFYGICADCLDNKILN